MMTFPIYGKIEKGNQTTNQYPMMKSDGETIWNMEMSGSCLGGILVKLFHTIKNTQNIWNHMF